MSFSESLDHLYLAKDEPEEWRAQSTREILQSLFKMRSFSHIDELDEALPLVKVTLPPHGGNSYVVETLSKVRADIPKFLYEIVGKWTQSTPMLHIESFTTQTFRFYELDLEPYLVTQLVIASQDTSSNALLAYRFSSLEKEITLALRSPYHARTILEMKGLTLDEKNALVQERITRLVHRFPERFDCDIYPIMQDLLVSASEEFKKARDFRQLSRIVSTLYLFDKRLHQEVEKNPHKRHIFLKFVRSTLEVPFGKKRVLGVFVGLHFLKENERFDQRHLLKAVKRFVSRAEAVSDSLFSLEKERFAAFYIELEKIHGEFSEEEISMLNRELAQHLRSSIEQLVRPLFMPQNTEVVMKYIVVLANQMRENSDLPQVVILYDEQTDKALFYTVVVMRARSGESASVEEIFLEQKRLGVGITIERRKKAGKLAKGWVKEAIVLKYRLNITPFLREDYAVDLYKARNKISQELEERLGEFRDYTGGMLTKQQQALEKFQEALQRKGQRNRLLIENFFHSLYPVEMRSVLSVETLTAFFQKFSDLLVTGAKKDKISFEDEEKLICVVKTRSHRRRELIGARVKELNIASSSLICLSLQMQENFYLGYLFFTESSLERKELISKVFG